MQRKTPIPNSSRRRCLQQLGGLFAVSAAGVSTGVRAADANEDRLIEQLIVEVENLHQGTFIRNGMSYDADKAARHLRDKLAYFKNDIHTADDFIRLCATRSEMTGIRYKVKDGAGVSQDAAEWLYTRLAKMRGEQKEGHSSTTTAAK